jgi:tetratricopeptide (TPR) repeat protein
MKKFILFGLFFLVLGGCATTDPGQSVDTVGDITVLVGKADQAYDQGKWKEAESAYRAVIAKSPNDGYAYFRLGNTLAKQSRLDEAAQAYTSALNDDANKTKAYQNLAIIRLEQADAALKTALKTIPETEGNAAQIKHMLYQLKKVTRVSLQNVTSPLAMP